MGHSCQVALVYDVLSHSKQSWPCFSNRAQLLTELRSAVEGWSCNSYGDNPQCWMLDAR